MQSSPAVDITFFALRDAYKPWFWTVTRRETSQIRRDHKVPLLHHHSPTVVEKVFEHSPIKTNKKRREKETSSELKRSSISVPAFIILVGFWGGRWRLHKDRPTQKLRKMIQLDSRLCFNWASTPRRRWGFGASEKKSAKCPASVDYSWLAMLHNS